MIVSGAALLLAGAAFLAYDLVTFRETMVRSLSIQAEIIGSASVSALEFDDTRSAKTTLSALKASPRILSAAIYTPDHRLFVEYTRDPDYRMQVPPEIPAGKTEVHSFQDDRLIIGKVIQFEGKTSGFIYIESDLHELNDRLSALRRNRCRNPGGIPACSVPHVVPIQACDLRHRLSIWRKWRVSFPGRRITPCGRPLSSAGVNLPN